jgi:hypothetical protein
MIGGQLVQLKRYRKRKEDWRREEAFDIGISCCGAKRVKASDNHKIYFCAAARKLLAGILPASQSPHLMFGGYGGLERCLCAEPHLLTDL